MPLLQKTIESLQRLIEFPSVSSVSNASVSEHVSEQLRGLGFDVEQTEYLDDNGTHKVNLVARRDPPDSDSPKPDAAGSGGLAYFCHTDVVPAKGWTGPGGDPFRGMIEGERIYGRGSCDMKGSLAVMMTAAEQVTAQEQTAPLWIVCTADEEVGFGGAKRLVKSSEGYRDIVSAQPLAIIGEPTRLSVVHAHKGIIGFRIVSQGRAAHSSTTSGINANEAMVPMLVELLELGRRSRNETEFQDDRFDPPILSWNFGVSDHCDAVNITPDRSDAWFSLRPMPTVSGEELIRAAESKAAALGLEFVCFEGGDPLWVEPDLPAILSMCELAGGSPKTVCYGTDGGEFSELTQRLVCGPGDIAQAHTTDEWLEFDQINRGIDLYVRAIRKWCT